MFKGRQQGFTLIEMAIVLVIIGILLGGVLKGQELIENSRTKRAAATIQAFSAAYNGYLDRYGKLPGDDGPLATLQARGDNWATITNDGNQNGVVNVADSPWNTGTDERVAFFQHLRAAGFITGDPTATGGDLLPRNSWGGLISVTNLATQGRATNRILQISMGNVPGKAATALDNQLDDGQPDTGLLRATVGGENVVPGAAAATYNEDNLYTICMDIM